MVKKFSEFIVESSLPDYEALPYNPKGTGEDFYKYVYGLFPKEWRVLEEAEVGTIWVHSDITSPITKKVIVDANEGNVYHYFRKASDGTWDEFEKRDMSRDSNEPVEHGVVVTNNDIIKSFNKEKYFTKVHILKELWAIEKDKFKINANSIRRNYLL